MKLTIVGMDFVGLVNAVGFAEKGHQIFALDSDKKKIAALRRNEVFKNENKLEELLIRNDENKILITKEDGSEVELTILLTFENEGLGYKYVLYYDENDENGEVLPFRYDEETHELSELETEEEWELANEVLETFLDEEQ